MSEVFGQSDYLSDYPKGFELRSDGIALVIIDMQYATGSRHHGLGRRLHTEGKGDAVKWRYDQIENKVVPNLSRLLEAFRRNRQLVVHVTIGSRTGDYLDLLPQIRAMSRSLENRVGHENHLILEELRPLDDELVLNKTTIGAFASTGLDNVLRVQGVRQVVIGGISTNACVAATAQAAADLGYETCIVSDACSAARQDYHLSALESFARLFGKVAPTEQVLAKLAEEMPV